MLEQVESTVEADKHWKDYFIVFTTLISVDLAHCKVFPNEVWIFQKIWRNSSKYHPCLKM